MKIKRSTIRHALLAALAGVSLAAAAVPAAAGEILWRVEGNFRAYSPSNEKPFEAFFSAVETYHACATGARSGPPCVQDRTQKFFYLGDDAPILETIKTTGLYHSAYIFDETRRVTLEAPGWERCIWRLRGERLAGQSCRVTARLPLGASEAEVENAAVAGEKRAARIEIRDVLIAIIGDSFISGEGLPHRPIRYRDAPSSIEMETGAQLDFKQPFALALWWDQRCHRSILSPASLAAMRYAAAHPQLSVTLVSYACSGAGIAEGLLSPYEGIESLADAQALARMVKRNGGRAAPFFQQQRMEGQVAALARTLCYDLAGANAQRCAPFAARVRPIDYLVISAGVNDIGFVKFAEDLITSDCDPSTACYARAKASVSASLARLFEADGAGPPLFRRLREAVSRELKPARVLLLPYVDPLRNEAGGYCDERRSVRTFLTRDRILNTFNIFVTEKESEGASNLIVKPLNEGIRRFAGEPESKAAGWSVVAYDDRSDKRGFCARPSWYLTLPQAVARQGIIPSKNISTGALHLNIAGSYEVSGFILAEMAKAR